MNYLFGPVNSRRLGRSLGVDLVPHKTCTMDCVYCECGGTTDLTTEIREYSPLKDVLAELDGYLSGAPPLDAVTFSGSGEPTLHSGIGVIIGHLKDNYPRYRVAVLTNGSLFSRREVRSSLLRADIVIPSLDAVSDEAFRAVTRPCPGIDPAEVVRGLVLFRKEFHGILSIEIFIVPGINDTDRELALLKEACLEIQPDFIQLNSLDRPGTEQWVGRAGPEELGRIARVFAPLAVSTVWAVPSHGAAGAAIDPDDMIRATLMRRPSTVQDLVFATGLPAEETARRVARLADSGILVEERGERGIFYRLREHGRPV